MTPDVHAVLHECTAASHEERMSFPQVVMALIAAGVERYHHDLCRGEITYYLGDGESTMMPTGKGPGTVNTVFSASGVEAAVRAIQTGQIAYNAFCQQVMAAGCAGWQASLLGKQVMYYGRTGETHTEYFPGSR